MNGREKYMKRQTILITGASGLVGSGFVEKIGKKADVGDLLCPSHEELDIVDFERLRNYINKHKPDVIINFAAHRNANTAEEQRNNKNGSAWKTNVIGTRNLVKICKQNRIYLIHISTDYVFSGYSDRKGPYSESKLPESDVKNLSWYGWTKYLAEKSVLTLRTNFSILRIGNVVRPIYDPKLDYIGKILWLFDQDRLYPLFNDQFVTLSYIPDIVLVIEKILEKKSAGIFHVASRDLSTPFKIAEYLIYKSRKQKGVVKKACADVFLKNFPNRYPKYGGLLTEKTQKTLGIKFGSWRDIVDNFIKYAN